MARQIQGHLIFTSSYVARMPHTQISSYAAAKAALENLARSLALEYALTGIRVNVVSPGNVAAGSSLKVFEEDPLYRDAALRRRAVCGSRATAGRWPHPWRDRERRRLR